MHMCNEREKRVKQAPDKRDPPVYLRKEDWEHRLGLLRAWEYWGRIEARSSYDRATFSAVMDGCAISVRALCDILDERCHFGNIKNELLKHNFQKLPENRDDRLRVYDKGQFARASKRIRDLCGCHKLAMLDVLYLANRAIAHPEAGLIDHKAEPCDLTTAINVLFGWLRKEDAESKQFIGLKGLKGLLIDLPLR